MAAFHPIRRFGQPSDKVRKGAWAGIAANARPSITVSIDTCGEPCAVVSQNLVVGAPAEPTAPDAAMAR